LHQAGLLLSRARSRTREIAVRLAIGAGRFRLIRLLLTESLILAWLGVLAGIAIGYGVVEWFHFYLNKAVEGPRIAMDLVGSMGVVGLLLAVAGLYGLVAYNASRRTREIGIRMALGAASSDILRQVMGKGLLLVGMERQSDWRWVSPSSRFLIPRCSTPAE
jgi:ABC-type antimicrobial peptide transport system permease subunit